MTAPTFNEAIVMDALRQVIDPELGCNLVDLGLIYSVDIAGAFVRVTMTVTSPGCPMHDSLRWGVHNAVASLENVTEVEVDLVFDPPWHPAMMTEAGRQLTGARF